MGAGPAGPCLARVGVEDGATEEGQQQEGHLLEHQDAEERGATHKTSGRHRIEQSGKVKRQREIAMDKAAAEVIADRLLEAAANLVSEANQARRDAGLIDDDR